MALPRAAGRHRIVLLPLLPKRRGRVEVDSLLLRCRGPLGLNQRVHRVVVGAGTDVVPDIRGVQTAALQFYDRDSPAGLKMQRDRGAGTEFDAPDREQKLFGSFSRKELLAFAFLPLTCVDRPGAVCCGMAKGFTLIEILVTLAILGVVLGLVIGHGPMKSRGLETRAAAGALAQGLRAARAQAIATDADVTVAIDPARHVFAADRTPPQLLAPDLVVAVLPPALRGPGTVRLIRFSPDGSATGGQVLLGTGRHRLGISVEWLTGKVTVADAP